MTSTYRNLSIRSKLFFVFGVSAVFIGGIIAVGVLEMHWMKTASAEAYRRTVSEGQSFYKLKDSLLRTRNSLLTAVVAKINKNAEGAEAHLEEAKKWADFMDGRIRELHASKELAPEVRKRLPRLEEIWEEFKATRDREVFPLLTEGRLTEAIGILEGIQEERFNELSSIADGIIEGSNKKAEETQAAVKGAFERTLTVYGAITVAGFIVAFFLIGVLSKELVARYRNIVDGIARFQKGEQVGINPLGTDELGRLEEALDGIFMQVYEHRRRQDQYVSIIDGERAELKKSEERFRGLVETTSDWVWEVDKNGVYTYASPRVRDILGYSPEEVLGKTPFDLMPPDEARRVSEIFARHLEKKEPFSGLENRNLHKEGHIVILETSGIPFAGTDGGFLGYRGINRDVTRRKREEEENASIRERLMQSEKMSSIGQLAAGVAHEINNPVGFVNSNLNTLSGYITSLTDLCRLYFVLMEAVEAGRTGEAREQVKKIQDFQREMDIAFIMQDIVFMTEESKDGMSRIKNIVQGLRDFSHSSKEEKMTAACLNRCVEDAVRLLWHEIKYVAELEKDLGELPEISCRPQQLTQVLINVIMNAVQAMERGVIRIRTWAEEKEVCVSITDNGCGMTEDVKKRIFDPFFTTKPVGKGTGLGLSIAYGIVTAHKGVIDVESEPGRGTTFTLRLPVDGEAAAAA